MEKVLFVALGGGIGAALRYLLTELANLHGGVFFPYGTILANLIGSFCIGILFVFFSESSDRRPSSNSSSSQVSWAASRPFRRTTWNSSPSSVLAPSSQPWPTSRSTSSAASSAAGLASPPATPCGDERRAARAARRAPAEELPIHGRLIGEVAQRAGEVEFPRGDLKTTPQGSKKRGCCIKTASF